MEASGRFVGIDLGKRTYDMCLVEPKGKITRTNGKTDFKGIDKLCEKLGADDLVAIEACNLAMRIERRIRQTVGCKVYILNPGKLAVIYMSTRKTHKEDALKLAKLLKNHDEDELPIVTPPTDEEWERRKLLSEYKSLKGARTREVKMDIKSVGKRFNIEVLIHGEKVEKTLTLIEIEKQNSPLPKNEQEKLPLVLQPYDSFSCVLLY